MVSGAPGVSTIPDAGPGLVTVLPEAIPPRVRERIAQHRPESNWEPPMGVVEYLRLGYHLAPIGKPGAVVASPTSWNSAPANSLFGGERLIFAERMGTSVTPARAAFFSVT
jgi:hypothetical protein